MTVVLVYNGYIRFQLIMNITEMKTTNDFILFTGSGGCTLDGYIFYK